MEAKIIVVNNELNSNIGSLIKELHKARGISQYYMGIAIALGTPALPPVKDNKKAVQHVVMMISKMIVIP